MVEDKLSNELDLTVFLSKIRDSYDLFKNVLSDHEMQYLKFNRDRIISYASDESEDKDQDTDITPLRQELRASIIKGLNIDKQYKSGLLILNSRNNAQHLWNPPLPQKEQMQSGSIKESFSHFTSQNIEPGIGFSELELR